MSLSNPNNPLSRLQVASSEPASNPFDVKIRRPAFKGRLDRTKRIWIKLLA